MTPQELKNSILQLAIQGKLVEQRAEEGTAEELYREIQKEKAALVKAGEIKKEKPLPEIAGDEKPFDIPESWKWCRIGEIADSNIGLTYKPSDIVAENGILVLRSSNIQNNKMAYDDNVFVSCFVPESSRIDKGDLLICARNGSRSLVGKCAIVDKEGCAFGAFMAKIKSPFVPYIKCFLDSPAYRSQLDGVKTETINQITQANLKNQIIPLPPLAEQKRIVAKIEELLPLIARYEQAWGKLENFNKRFPVDMQKSILQMAIEGKLVAQRPEDGTGETLYREIQAEKQKLIKSGKIKKDKPLPPITEDEIPFEIPDSWKWVRLGECSNYAQTKEKISAVSIRPDMWSLDLEDIEKETGKIINVCKAENRKIIGDKVVFHKGQILYSKLRPYLKKILIAPSNGICTPELVPFDVYGDIDKNFIVNVLQSPHADFTINSVTYGVKMPRVGTDTMINLLIPLPPLAEQHRIVAKLEELLPLCEKLK